LTLIPLTRLLICGFKAKSTIVSILTVTELEKQLTTVATLNTFTKTGFGSFRAATAITAEAAPSPRCAILQMLYYELNSIPTVSIVHDIYDLGM